MKKKFAIKINNKKKNPRKHRIVKKIIALSFLPPDKVKAALNKIEVDAIAELSDYKPLKEFLQYFRTEWIGNVKIENFNYCDMDERTNNVLEAYHKNIGKELGAKPHVLNFLGIKFFSTQSFQ